MREQERRLEEISDTDLDIAPPKLPKAEPPEDGPDPLVVSEMPLIEAIEILRERKNYNGD